MRHRPTPEDTVYDLVFADEHPLAKQTLDLPLKAPYIYTYDTRTLRVDDFKSFKDSLQLVTLKALLINSIDTFITGFSENLKDMAIASAECSRNPETGAAPQRQGKALVNQQTYTAISTHILHLVNEAHMSISKWDGGDELNLLFPYNIRAVKEDKNGKVVVDTNASNPYIMGMLFIAKWK